MESKAARESARFLFWVVIYLTRSWHLQRQIERGASDESQN
jgi:hypothetical protein